MPLSIVVEARGARAEPLARPVSTDGREAER